MKPIFHLKCSCGRDRHLALDDMPPQWLEPGGRAIRSSALAIMKCLHFGHRGAPAHVEYQAGEGTAPAPFLTPIGMSAD